MCLLFLKLIFYLQRSFLYLGNLITRVSPIEVQLSTVCCECMRQKCEDLGNNILHFNISQLDCDFVNFVIHCFMLQNNMIAK